MECFAKLILFNQVPWESSQVFNHAIKQIQNSKLILEEDITFLKHVQEGKEEQDFKEIINWQIPAGCAATIGIVVSITNRSVWPTIISLIPGMYGIFQHVIVVRQNASIDKALNLLCKTQTFVFCVLKCIHKDILMRKNGNIDIQHTMLLRSDINRIISWLFWLTTDINEQLHLNQALANNILYFPGTTLALVDLNEAITVYNGMRDLNNSYCAIVSKLLLSFELCLTVGEYDPTDCEKRLIIYKKIPRLIKIIEERLGMLVDGIRNMPYDAKHSLNSTMICLENNLEWYKEQMGENINRSGQVKYITAITDNQNEDAQCAANIEKPISKMLMARETIVYNENEKRDHCLKEISDDTTCCANKTPELGDLALCSFQNKLIIHKSASVDNFLNSTSQLMEKKEITSKIINVPRGENLLSLNKKFTAAQDKTESVVSNKIEAHNHYDDHEYIIRSEEHKMGVQHVDLELNGREDTMLGMQIDGELLVTKKATEISTKTQSSQGDSINIDGTSKNSVYNGLCNDENSDSSYETISTTSSSSCSLDKSGNDKVPFCTTSSCSQVPQIRGAPSKTQPIRVQLKRQAQKCSAQKSCNSYQQHTYCHMATPQFRNDLSTPTVRIMLPDQSRINSTNIQDNAQSYPTQRNLYTEDILSKHTPFADNEQEQVEAILELRRRVEKVNSDQELKKIDDMKTEDEFTKLGSLVNLSSDNTEIK